MTYLANTKYLVSIKSHTEAPDYEREFEDEELTDHRCKISWADDVDEEGQPVGGICGGILIEKDGGDLECSACGTIYAKNETSLA